MNITPLYSLQVGMGIIFNHPITEKLHFCFCKIVNYSRDIIFIHLFISTNKMQKMEKSKKKCHIGQYCIHVQPLYDRSPQPPPLPQPMLCILPTTSYCCCSGSPPPPFTLQSPSSQAHHSPMVITVLANAKLSLIILPSSGKCQPYHSRQRIM